MSQRLHHGRLIASVSDVVDAGIDLLPHFQLAAIPVAVPVPELAALLVPELTVLAVAIPLAITPGAPDFDAAHHGETGDPHDRCALGDA